MAPDPLPIPQSIRFGEDLELDRPAYELRRSGRALKLERIPLDILFLLAERPGQLVTREEIAELPARRRPFRRRRARMAWPGRRRDPRPGPRSDTPGR